MVLSINETLMFKTNSVDHELKFYEHRHGLDRICAVLSKIFTAVVSTIHQNLFMHSYSDIKIRDWTIVEPKIETIST